MSRTVPVREFRTHLAYLLDEVAVRREHVTVTRRGLDDLAADDVASLDEVRAEHVARRRS